MNRSIQALGTNFAQWTWPSSLNPQKQTIKLHTKEIQLYNNAINWMLSFAEVNIYVAQHSFGTKATCFNDLFIQWNCINKILCCSRNERISEIQRASHVQFSVTGDDGVASCESVSSENCQARFQLITFAMSDHPFTGTSVEVLCSVLPGIWRRRKLSMKFHN